MGSGVGDYLEDLWDDLEDALEDFWKHLTGKPLKKHKKLKKKAKKRGRPAYALAERVRGVMNVVVGVTVVVAAAAAATDGITGVRDVASFLVNTLPGRILLGFIGVCYLTYGVWKLVMGAD